MDPSSEVPRFLDIEDTPIIRDRAGSLSVYRIPNEDGGTVQLRKGLLLNITFKEENEDSYTPNRPEKDTELGLKTTNSPSQRR